MMSDETLLGALPEEDAQRLLDWTLGRLEEAARKASDLDGFLVAADAIRAEARRIGAGAADGARLPEGAVGRMLGRVRRLFGGGGV